MGGEGGGGGKSCRTDSLSVAQLIENFKKNHVKYEGKDKNASLEDRHHF